MELTNSETSNSLYGLYIMDRLFGPRIVIQYIVQLYASPSGFPVTEGSQVKNLRQGQLHGLTN